jgi:hypothetical protein
VVYVGRLLPLTCLVPDIVEAILEGRQPKGLRLDDVLGNGPLVWEEQRCNWLSFSSDASAVLTRNRGSAVMRTLVPRLGWGITARTFRLPTCEP